MPVDPRLRDQLCDLEPQNPLLRERFTRELFNMLERKLTTTMKAFVGLVMLVSLGLGIALGTLAWIHAELPVLARAGLAGGMLFSLAWAGLAGWTLRRGSLQVQMHSAAAAGLSWTFAVLLETCFLLLAPQFPDPFHAQLALFCGLVLLIGAGVMLVCSRVQQAEIQMREALLRLEYRLAELVEARANLQ